MEKRIFMTLLLGAFFLSVKAAAAPVEASKAYGAAQAQNRSQAQSRSQAKKAPAAPPPLVNLYWSGCYNAPKNMEGDVPADSSYAFSHGIKLNWDTLDFRLFNSCKKTGGGDFWPMKGFGDYEKIFDRRRASIALDFSKRQKALKTKVAAGSLSLYTQKRVAPFSTAVSPFAFGVPDAGALLASLPTKSSNPQADSIYAAASLSLPAQWGSDTIRFMPLKAEFAATKNASDPDKTPFAASVRGGLFYMNFFKLTAGLLASRSYFEERSEAAEIDWFDAVPVFRSGLCSAWASDLCVEIPFLKSKTTFSVAEGWGSFGQKSLGRAAFAQELLFEAKSFSFAAAFFASDNLFLPDKSPWVAANGREYKKVWQAKIAPQLSFVLRNGGRLKIGAGGFLEEQIKDYSKKSQRTSLEAKAAVGVQLCRKRDSAKLTASAGPIVLKESPGQEKAPPLPKISASFYCSHIFDGPLSGRLALSGGASFQPELDWQKREWTERFKLAFYPKRGLVSCVSAGFSASQKDGRRKFEPTAAASFLFRLKCVRLNASVSAAFPLVF